MCGLTRKHHAQEVGDIPYAADFRDEEPFELSFGEYLAMVNRSQPDTGGKYWFSEHHVRAHHIHNRLDRDDPYLVKDRKINDPMQRVAAAMTKALGLTLNIILLQLILGPARSGAPLHFHIAALNLAVKGGTRWFFQPIATLQSTLGT